MSTRVALFQMTSGIVPEANAAAIVEAAREARAGGASILFTPEMCGLIDRDRTRARKSIVPEESNPVLAACREVAVSEGIWIALGSLAVEKPSGKWANRSFLLDPSGQVVARYDKMHMFDVQLASGETWHESAAYEAGNAIVTAKCPIGQLGLTICYDIRFPALFSALGGCDAIAIPAAFTVPTGTAHWHLLQRARAVEASAYVISAAQVGRHEDGRTTYGHSLVVDPWGEVLLDMGGTESGIGFVDIDPARIEHVREQLPSLANRRDLPKSPQP